MVQPCGEVIFNSAACHQHSAIEYKNALPFTHQSEQPRKPRKLVHTLTHPFSQLASQREVRPALRSPDFGKP